MERLTEWILALVMIGSTLAFGGVQPLTISLSATAILLTLLFLLVKQTRSGRIQILLPVWPLLFILLILFQLVPVPWSLKSAASSPWLSGLTFTHSGGIRSSWSTSSVYPHDTFLALIRLVATFGVFVLAAFSFESQKRRSILLHGLVLLGLFEAGYGVVQYLTGSQKIFGIANPFATEEATGTYINRNHFAGLLELTIPLAAAYAFYYFQLWCEERGRHRSRERGETSNVQMVFYTLLLLFLLVGLILSRSRMGIVAGFSSLTFIVVLGHLRVKRGAWTVLFLALLVCVVGYVFWIGVGPVLARLEPMGTSHELQMEGRIPMWRDTLRIIGDFPLIGTGLGTFATCFRHYQRSAVEFTVDHAHNDYLEYAAETGIIGLVLLFVPILWLWRKMIPSFLDDSRRFRRAMTLGCIGSTLAILLHSLTDFNLQIPANAFIFAAVLGVGYKAACLERGGEQDARSEPPAAVFARGGDLQSRGLGIEGFRSNT